MFDAERYGLVVEKVMVNPTIDGPCGGIYDVVCIIFCSEYYVP